MIDREEPELPGLQGLVTAISALSLAGSVYVPASGIPLSM